MSLNGKRVIIFGGTGGIGLATAQAAATHGAEVIVASGLQSSVDKALTVLPASTKGIVVDLRDSRAIEEFFAGSGEFDHLVYTAGEALAPRTLADATIASARDFFEVRYWGALTSVKHAAGLIRPGGSITLTSGATSQRPLSGWTVPTSVCAAMEGLTRALAVELAPIRVNAVRPGIVRTDLWRNVPDADLAALYADAAKALPVGRIGEPEDVAQSYLYLMDQDYTTGTIITVDGGHLLV
jgi:NAD(P)-dependent dehydrogenase (short-subunit alcohol dehydrogenase family)